MINLCETSTAKQTTLRNVWMNYLHKNKSITANRYVCNYWHLGTNWTLAFEMCTELKDHYHALTTTNVLRITYTNCDKITKSSARTYGYMYGFKRTHSSNKSIGLWLLLCAVRTVNSAWYSLFFLHFVTFLGFLFVCVCVCMNVLLIVKPASLFY